jgi:hypothetical protein
MELELLPLNQDQVNFIFIYVALEEVAEAAKGVKLEEQVVTEVLDFSMFL